MVASTVTVVPAVRLDPEAFGLPHFFSPHPTHALALMQTSFEKSSRLISLIPVVVTLLVTTILVVLIREQGRTIAMI